MKRKLNRRTFLRATGVAVALPALDAMVPDPASAATLKHFGINPDAPAKRMIMICTSLGLHGKSLFPDATGKNYKLTPYLSHLEDHRSDFTIFSGLSHPDQSGADGHSSQMTWLTSARHPGLGGFRNSISVDQFVREKLGYVTRYPSIALATGGQNSQSYTSGGVMVPAEYRPSVLFEKLFLAGKPWEIEHQKRRLDDGRSILDSLGGQASRLKRRISAADRDRLDEYFSSLRAAENHFNEARQWIDKPKPAVDAEKPEDIKQASDVIGQTNLLFDLLPLIVQTDSSRVITILINGRSDVPPIDGVTMDHHNLSHHGQDESKLKQLAKIENELMKSFGGLVGQLKEKQEANAEGETRLLDNTMVMFGSNLGNANAHDTKNLPILVAGGDYQHGQHIVYNKKENTPLCNLFVSMMQKMNLPVDQFGSSDGSLSW